MSTLPLIVNASNWEVRQSEGIDRQEAGLVGRQGRYQDYGTGYYGQSGSYPRNYGYPNPNYDSYYGNYNYNYPSYSQYSTYPIYPNQYAYPGYRPYYYNPGMYNPNTTFVNPPSSLNSPTGYPSYSETYVPR